MRRGQFMSMDIFKKIVDESEEMGCRKFVINGLGEPLIDPHLEDKVGYVHRTLYGVPTEIYTNGEFLTPERFKQLKVAGLQSIVVSLNAVRRSQHIEIMGLKSFETVCANIDYAIKTADHVSIAVHTVMDGDQFNDMDAREFRARWERHAKVFLMGNWMGEKDQKHAFKPNSYCSRSDQTMYIAYDGKVTMCCFDPTGKTVFGDVNKNTLREIHNGCAYASFRQAHAEDRADEYEQCATCTRI